MLGAALPVATRTPIQVRVDGKLAGLALVIQQSYLSGDRNTTDIDEFFIMRKYRRRGVGKEAAMRIFDSTHRPQA